MINLFNKFFLKTKNLNSLNIEFKKIERDTEIKKIFNAIENFSKNSEIRYVGGCVRKILNNEKYDDIDLATNLNPHQVSEALKKNNIKFYDTGIKHGTLTAIIDKKSFEITSLRKDIATDGRHAEVKFSNDWYEDATRRDFTINSIYSDIDGNLFDPFNGKKDLDNGEIKFIGNPEKRIMEDYLRVLRYVRFFLNYSQKDHNKDVIRIIKKNLGGISRISPERLLDEFKKITNSKKFLELAKDDVCKNIINLIFPQFKYLETFENLNDFAKKNIDKIDFIIKISLLVIDSSDNAEYFLYKFNLSNKDKKRILFINNFYKSKISAKTFRKDNLKKILYFEGKQSLMDLLYYEIFKTKKFDKNIVEIINFFKNKEPNLFPYKAANLMKKYNINEGKELGKKLKEIEEIWVENNFKISDKEVDKIIKN